MELNALNKQGRTNQFKAHFNENFDDEPLMGPTHKFKLTKTAAEAIEVPQSKYRDSSPKPRKDCTPIWIKRRVILIFLIILTACWIGLVIVWRIGVTENGFALTLTQNRLAWKYGPTAILVVILSLWRKVDYHCKWSQPWINLSKGGQPASRTILLDYLNPIDEVSFVRSLRAGDYQVSLAVLCARLLQLAVILSTTLFTAIRTESQKNIPVTYNTTFDGSAYWNIINAGQDLQNSTLPPVFTTSDASSTARLSDQPVNAYLGTIAQDTYLVGSDKNVAYQTFSEVTNQGVQEASAVVDIFVPRVECRVAQVEHVPLEMVAEAAQENAAQLAALFIYAENCPISTEGARSNSTAFTAMAWADSACDSAEGDSHSACSRISTGNNRVTCGDPRFLGDAYSFRKAKRDVSDESILSNYTKLLYWSVNTTTTPLDPNNATTEYTYGVSQTMAFLCDVDYSIQSINLTQNPSLRSFGTPDISNASEGRYLDDLSRDELLDFVDRTLSTAGGIGPILTRTFNISAYDQVVFQDSNVMNEALIDLLSGTAAQFMRQYFLVPNVLQGSGLATVDGNRLTVNNITLWIMVASLILSSLATLAMLLHVKTTSLPYGSPTLAQSAHILATNPELEQRLIGCGHMAEAELNHRLHGFSTSLTGHRAQNIVLSLNKALGTESLNSFKGDQGQSTVVLPLIEPWMPLSSQVWIVCTTFILPIAFIIVIEVLYRQSVRDDGLASLSPGNAGSTLVTLVPIFLLVLIALMFQNYDFMSALVAPYNQLNSSKDALYLRLLGRYPLVSLWTSINHGHYGSFFAKVAALLCGLLTIVGSDLLFFDTKSSHTSEFAVLQETDWNWQWPNSGLTDNGAAQTFDQIRLGTLATPPSIWNSYVMPDIGNYELPSQSLSNEVGQRNYSVTVPALQPHLECEAVPQSALSVAFFAYGSFADRINITVQTEVPSYCSNDGLVTWTSQWIGTDYEGYVGLLYNLYLGPGQNNSNNVNSSDLMPGYRQTMFNATTAPDNPVGCPSLGIIYGHMTPYEDSNSTDLSQMTALLCRQMMKQTPLKVTLQPRDNETDLRISQSQPPLPQTDQTRFLTNGSADFDAYSYRIQDPLAALLSNDLEPVSIRNYGIPIDRLFTRILNEKSIYHVDPAALVGAEHSPALISAVQGIYEKYMVNAINLNLKSTPTDPQRLTGAVEIETSRLKVGWLSKVLVQSLLAAIIVFGGLAHLLCRVRGVLPRSPCSIASNLAFFAGSRLCADLGTFSDATSMNEKELKAAISGRNYGFGWWNIHNVQGHGVAEDLDNLALSTAHWRFGLDIGVPQISKLRPTESRSWFRRRTDRYRPVTS